MWVVDDSATMYEEHELLMNSADAFIGFVSNSVVDFRLGVVSTDIEAGGGSLLGPVLTVESSQMVDTFVSQIATDRAGSRDERGFDAAVRAADPAVNTEFARAKADLEMVIFSDEDDHSSMNSTTFLSTLGHAVQPQGRRKLKFMQQLRKNRGSWGHGPCL